MAGGVEGLNKLMAQFGELGGVIASEHMEKAVANQIKMVQAEAKLMCPVNNGELRNSIKTTTEVRDGVVSGICYTNKKYASYVEFGTGPKGEADHAGISPEVSPAYTQSPWWIHESQIDAATAEKYKWPSIDTPEGRFYKCSGQAAQPFIYPALKNNEERATRNIANYLARKIKEELGG